MLCMFLTITDKKLELHSAKIQMPSDCLMRTEMLLHKGCTYFGIAVYSYVWLQSFNAVEFGCQ